ncbi:hypothetical protein [Cellulosimicrobium protaetiae]
MTHPLHDADRDRLRAAATDTTKPLRPAERATYDMLRRHADRDDAALIDAALRGPAPDRPTRARPAASTW